MNHIFNELIGKPPTCKDCPTDTVHYCETTGYECSSFKVWTDESEKNYFPMQPDHKDTIGWHDYTPEEKNRILKVIMKSDGRLHYCVTCGHPYMTTKKDQPQCVFCQPIGRINKVRTFVCSVCGEVFESTATYAKSCPEHRIEYMSKARKHRHRMYVPERERVA